MKTFDLKKYFNGFDNVIRSLLVISLFLFFLTFFLFQEITLLNYSMYVPAAMIFLLSAIYYAKKRKFPDLRPMICVYAFVAIAYVTSFIANPRAALAYTTLIVLAFFSTSVYLSCRIIGDVKVVLWALLVASLSLAIGFIAVYFKDIVKLNFSQRLGSFFGNENSVAIKLSVSAALLVSVGVYEKKYWLPPIAVIIFALVAFTGSKKGLIYIGIITIFGILSFFRKRMKVGLVVCASAIVAMLLLLFLVPAFQTIKSRLMDYVNYLFGNNADTSSFSRSLYKNTAFYLSFKNLLIGYGVDGFNVASGIGTYSHDNISELICDFGLFGLVSFYAIFVYIGFKFKNVIRKPDASIVFYLLLLCYLVTSTTVVFYYDKLPFVLFSVCIFINETRNVTNTKIKIG